ncbi:MAG: hypothetical protein COB93_08520, partial [Sneathiella sp.]
MSEMTWLPKSTRSRFTLSTQNRARKSEGRPISLRLDGSAKETLEQGRNRLVMAGAIFAFCFVILAGRLVGLA